MTNLPITVNTTPPGKAGNALQAGNGAEAGTRRTVQRSFADAISAQLASAAGLPAVTDTPGEIPVSFSDVLNRHIGTAKTDSATDTAAGISATDGDDALNGDLAVTPDARGNREPVSASVATADASGIVSSMMHQVATRQSDSTAVDTSGNTPVEQGKSRNRQTARANIATTTMPAKRPELATRDSGPAKAVPVELADETSAHADAAPLRDEARPAAVAASGKQSDRNLTQIGGPNQVLEKTATSIRSEARRAPGIEKQSVQNTPQAATDKSAKIEPALLPVNSPSAANAQPGQAFSQLMSRPGDNVAGADRADKSNTLNIAKTVNTTQTTDAAAANLLKADHGRAPLAINVSAPLGSSDWPKEFSQKIIWMGDHKNQVAELHLNPPDLGPLDVVLKVSGNQATAQFTSPHSAVRDAVENALPKLREMLAENGVTLGNTSVSDQAPQYRGTDGSAGQDTAGNSQQGTPNQIAHASDPATAETPVVAARQHNGLVDTFA